MADPFNIRITSQAELAAVQQTQSAFNQLNANLVAQNRQLKSLTSGFSALMQAQSRVFAMAAFASQLRQLVLDIAEATKALWDMTSAMNSWREAAEGAKHVHESLGQTIEKTLTRMEQFGEAAPEKIKKWRQELEAIRGMSTGTFSNLFPWMYGLPVKELQLQQLAERIISQQYGRKASQAELQNRRLELQFAIQEAELQERSIVSGDQIAETSKRVRNDKEKLLLIDQQLGYLAELHKVNEDEFQRYAITEEENRKRSLALQREELDLYERRREVLMDIHRQTFGGAMYEQVQQLRMEWGNMSQVMARTLTGTVVGGVQSLSNALAQVITRTQSAAEAFRQFALQMATQFIASVTQMVLMATVAIPILSLFGLPLAPFRGLVQMGGFEEGGIIPGSPSSRDNRLAMVATGEYVARAAAVQYYGAEVFEALNSMRIPPDLLSGWRIPVRGLGGSAFASGGLVGGSGGLSAQPARVSVLLFDDRKRMEEYMQSTSGQKLIVSTVHASRVDLGIV